MNNDAGPIGVPPIRSISMPDGAFAVRRWTRVSAIATSALSALILAAALGPALLGDNAIDKLTTLFIYVILAVTWNAMAGYGGLVSIGQQAFFGLGAYFTIRLSAAGISVYPSLLLAALAVGAIAIPLSFVMLRLRAGELAIGMWVVAELAHLLVNLDALVQGETGTSLVALNAYDSQTRHAVTYWMALACMALVLGLLFALLRSRRGIAIQAIRDSEEAAASVGVRVAASKRLLFVFAAVGAGVAGALWLATSISFQPKTYFGVQWTAYMIFMVLVGGLGTFEGPLIGALVFFGIEAEFGASGVWYLVGLGGTALLLSLFLPAGIWGFLEGRGIPRLFGTGYRLDCKTPSRRNDGRS